MLADEEMTIEGIHGNSSDGPDKAETTVRHHVNVLKDAGMVEIARLEEAGGGTRYTTKIEYADVDEASRGQRPDTQRGAGTPVRGAANTTRVPL